MKGLGRNIKFWLWMLNKTLATMLGCVLVTGVLLSFMEGDWSTLLEFVPTYMMLLTFLTVFLNALNTNLICFPVSVSFGSGRKQSSIAMQIAQHIVAAEQVLLLCVCNLIFPDAEQAALLKAYPISFIGIYLLLLGFGTMISVISICCGKVFGLIVYLVAVVGMVIVGFFTVLTVASNGLNLGSTIMQFLDSPLPLIIGILVDACLIVVHLLAVRKVDLKLA